MLRKGEAYKPDAATFAFLLAWLFYTWSGVEGLLHAPTNSYMVSASESGWVYLWYNIAMVVAGLGGLTASLRGMREGEAHALFVLAGLFILHGLTLLTYAPDTEDWRGMRMLGSAMVAVAFGISLRRVARLHQEIVEAAVKEQQQ